MCVGEQHITLLICLPDTALIKDIHVWVWLVRIVFDFFLCYACMRIILILYRLYVEVCVVKVDLAQSGRVTYVKAEGSLL